MSDATSLIFYIAIFSVATLLFWYSYRSKKHFLFALFAMLLLSVVAAVRFEVGTDYVAYANTFKMLNGISLSDFSTYFGDQYEVGIYLVAQVAGLFPYSLQVFFGIFNFITLLFFFLAVRKYKLPYPWLITLLYLFIMFPSSFNAVRQMTAVSIFFYATTFIHDKKIVKYAIFSIIAVLFHKSAILLLPLYFLVKLFPKGKVLSTRNIVILILITSLFMAFGSVITSLMLDLSIFDKYDKYQTASAASGGAVLGLKMLVMATILFAYKYIKKYPYCAFCVVMALIEIIVLAISRSSVDIARFSVYFSPFSLILLSYLPRLLKGGQQLVVILLVIAYAIAIFYITFYLLGGSEIFPYQFSLSRGGA